MLPIDFQLISTDAFIIAKLLHGSYDIKIDIYVTVTAGASKTRNEQFLKLAVVRSREFSFDKNIFKKATDAFNFLLPNTDFDCADPVKKMKQILYKQFFVA